MQNLKQAIKNYLRDKWWHLKTREKTNPPLPKNPGAFVFICRGNLCRSPFAEYRAGKICDNPRFLFSSAGLAVTISNPPPEQALQAAAGFDIDLSAHRSREVESSDMSSADMILVMEHSHLSELQGRYPAHTHKMFLLPLFDDAAGREMTGYARCNIFDPYGKNIQDFKTCFGRIDRCLNNLFNDL